MCDAHKLYAQDMVHICVCGSTVKVRMCVRVYVHHTQTFLVEEYVCVIHASRTHKTTCMCVCVCVCV